MPLTVTSAPLKTFGQYLFNGGLNLRDHPSEIQPHESPDMWNVTIDWKGGIQKRTGFTKWNDSGQPSSLIVTGYYSALQDKTFWQAGRDIYPQTGRQPFAASIRTFSSDDRISMVDFAGRTYFLHPADGLYSYDGTNLTSVGTAPTGLALAVWQNRLWIIRPSSTTVAWSSRGDGSSWSGSGAGTNDIVVKDSAPLTAIIAAETEGLVVYKRDSTYRINDPATGSYQTLSVSDGCAGPAGVVASYGSLWSISPKGIFVTDGLTKLNQVGDRVLPLFSPSQFNLSKQALWCAGRRGDKVYFSVTRQGSATNNLVLELHPVEGWIVPHSCAVSCYVNFISLDEKLLAGSPTVSGQTYEMYGASGQDDGAAIASRAQTAWFRPAQLHACQFHQLRLRGRGSFDFYVKTDQQIGDGDSHGTLTLKGDQVSTWDGSSDWGPSANVGIWGPESYAGDTAVWSLGRGRDISFEMRETGSGIGTVGSPLDGSSQPVLGYWALHGLTCEYTQGGVS